MNFDCVAYLLVALNVMGSTLISKIMAESWIRVQDGLKHDIDLLDQCWDNIVDTMACVQGQGFSKNYLEKKHFKLFLYLFFFN